MPAALQPVKPGEGAETTVIHTAGMAEPGNGRSFASSILLFGTRACDRRLSPAWILPVAGSAGHGSRTGECRKKV